MQGEKFKYDILREEYLGKLTLEGDYNDSHTLIMLDRESLADIINCLYAELYFACKGDKEFKVKLKALGEDLKNVWEL